MFRLFQLAPAAQIRPFSSGSVSRAVYKSKSFSKKKTFDSSKNRKGSGKDKRFNKVVLSVNYRKFAQDQKAYESLPEFSPETLYLDEVVRYKEPILKKLHIMGAFKPHQYNEVFSKPVTLSRKIETKKIDDFVAKSLTSSSKENRLIITGDKGVGKSTLLTQFHALALEKEKNVILQFNHLDMFLDGSTDYKLNQSTGLYDQPMATRRFLKKFYGLNKEVLAEIEASKPFGDASESSKQTLDAVLKAHMSNPATNHTELFAYIVDELAIQTAVPVYLSIDNFSAVIQYAMSRYRDKDNLPIYFQKFQVLKTLVEFISGDRSFAKGAVIAAMHSGHKTSDTIPVVLGLKEPDHYAKFAQWDREFTNQLTKNGAPQQLQVERFTRDQVQAIVQYLIECNVIEHEVQKRGLAKIEDPEVVVSRLADIEYVLSGNGNPKELYRNCLFSFI